MHGEQGGLAEFGGPRVVQLQASVVSRSGLLPLLPLGVLVMFVDGRRRAAIGLLTLAAVVIAPLAIRNHGLNGSLLPTRGGRIRAAGPAWAGPVRRASMVRDTGSGRTGAGG